MFRFRSSVPCLRSKTSSSARPALRKTPGQKMRNRVGTDSDGRAKPPPIRRSMRFRRAVLMICVFFERRRGSRVHYALRVLCYLKCPKCRAVGGCRPHLTNAQRGTDVSSQSLCFSFARFSSMPKLSQLRQLPVRTRLSRRPSTQRRVVELCSSPAEFASGPLPWLFRAQKGSPSMGRGQRR